MGEFIDKASSFAKAMAVQIAAGCPITDKNDQLERHKVCQSCDQLNKEEYRCNVCSCYLTLKVALATSKCPLNKWPDLTKEKKCNENKSL